MHVVLDRGLDAILDLGAAANIHSDSVAQVHREAPCSGNVIWLRGGGVCGRAGL
jgi:hypothetical protein